MGRERFIGKLQSALAEQRRLSDQRRLSHEQGHVSIDAIPQDQEITLMVQPGFRECLDTRVFNQSVTTEWMQIDPKEDYRPDTSRPSRIGPAS